MKMSKKTKEKIIKALENKSDDEIEEEFSDLIVEKMNDKQFWKYIKSWRDTGDIIEQMQEWDVDIKRDEIENIKENFLK